MENNDKIPVIFSHGTSGRGHELFQFNLWQGDSKLVVQSCITQYSLINYTVIQLDNIFENLETICQKRLKEYPFDLEKDKWDFAKCIFLMENPIIHLYIQAFLGQVKSLLDIIIHLLNTEGIVSTQLMGFNKQGKIIGGRVLNVLRRNVTNGKENTALHLIDLINRHKERWIDIIIGFRDSLVHLPRGMMQIMVQVELANKENKLALRSVTKPSVGGILFNQLAHSTLENLDGFCGQMISILKAK